MYEYRKISIWIFCLQLLNLLHIQSAFLINWTKYDHKPLTITSLYKYMHAIAMEVFLLKFE